MNSESKFSRDAKLEETIAAGKQADLLIHGDWFLIDSITDGAGNATTIDVQINGQSQFTRARAGQGGQGRVGQGEIQIVRFKNNSGGPITVYAVGGNGAVLSSGIASMAGGTVSISTASIAALLNVKTLKVDANQVANPAVKVFPATCKAVWIMANGADAVVTSPSGMNMVLAAGDYEDWSIENDEDFLEQITATPGALGSISYSIVYA